MMAGNQKAPHFITQYCLDRLREKGRIVNIGSLGGRSALPPFAAYAATKRALQSLTMSTAVVVAPRGIPCNLVAPGAVDTEFNSALLEKPGWAGGTAKLTPTNPPGAPHATPPAVTTPRPPPPPWRPRQNPHPTAGPP